MDTSSVQFDGDPVAHLGGIGVMFIDDLQMAK